MRDKTTYIFAMVALISIFCVISSRSALAADSPAETPDIKKFMLKVPGADCASTGAEADNLLRGIEGVTSVSVDIETTTAVIVYDATKASLEHIKQVMKSAGYPVTAVEELKQ